MTIDELIEKLTTLREKLGGDAKVDVRNPAGDIDDADSVEHLDGTSGRIKANSRVFIDT